MPHEFEITSPHNPRLKLAVKLRDRGARREQARFLIDGLREITRAFQAGCVPEEIFVPVVAFNPPDFALMCDEWRTAGVQVYPTAPAAFEKLAYGDREQGFVAVAKSWRLSLDELKLPETPLLIVVDSVEKPGNLGAILRTANAAGVAAVISTGNGTDWFNPNTVRASLGALFSTPVCTASAEDAIPWLQSQGLRIFAARVDAAVEYTSVSYCEPCVIVLGSEAEGLGLNWSAANCTGIYLPMRGQVDSLNVSVTAAVLCYEAQRQRRVP